MASKISEIKKPDDIHEAYCITLSTMPIARAAWQSARLNDLSETDGLKLIIVSLADGLDAATKALHDHLTNTTNPSQCLRDYLKRKAFPTSKQ